VYDDPLDEATQNLRAHEARRVVEAVVMAATDPVEPSFLAQLVELPVASIEELCRELAAEYDDAGRGFVLVKVAGGYRYQTHPDLSPYVERFVLEGQHSRLSAPAFETLAIVAYKQPILRADIEAIRGVACGETVRSLMEKHLVKIAGRAEEPGRPILYGTTKRFLELFGLNSLKDLPQPDNAAKPTLSPQQATPATPQE
jgi:segregation and condensation protein B